MKIKTDTFEGPLDLLLSMIEEEKLDITEISLANIAQQYIEYIENNKNINPEEMADFLVIAARLLLIKSKTLLPYLIREDEEEEIKDFSRQLKIYKDFLEASRIIEQMAAGNSFMYARDILRLDSGRVFYPPPNVSAGVMHANFCEIVDRLEPQEILAEDTIIKSVSMEERMTAIKDYLQKLEQLSFNRLLEDANTEIDVIVNFIAVLELIKQRVVSVRQTSMFAEIKIIKI